VSGSEVPLDQGTKPEVFVQLAQEQEPGIGGHAFREAGVTNRE
jgi:hypothetical protein